MRLSTLLLAMLCVQLSWSQSAFSVEGADTGAFNPIDLIENVCLGPGIQIMDIEYEGDPAAVGRFFGGTPYVNIGEGFLMTTGHAANLSGGAGADNFSEVTASVSNDSQVPYFPELAALANSTDMHDLSVYTITFVPTGDSVLFRYAFASEEYPQFVCSSFNDAFAFFLEGPDADGNVVSRNLAQIPQTDLPVSINSVNGGIPGSHPSVSLFYCNDLQNGSLDYAEFFNLTAGGSYPTYNGYTDVFEARAAVTPCEEYTMTLAIADFGDELWDSAIFFEAESFCSTPGPSVDTLPIVLEACAPPSVPINLEYFPETEYPLAYFVGGTAEAGVDYFGLNGAGGFIEEPTDIWQVILPVLDEGEEEGIETIELRIFGSNCLERTVIIPIADRVRIEGPIGGACSSEPVTLQVVGDPAVLAQFEFEWSTGETGTSISVIPDEPETYFLTYSNVLATCSAIYNLEVGNPEADIQLELCSNEDGIEINGTIYNFDNPSGTEVLEGASVAGCDSIVNIQIVPQVLAAFFPEVCQNETITVNGTEYGRNNPVGIEILSGAAANGCDSVVRINVVPLEVAMEQLREEICDNEAIEVNGTVYDKANPVGTEIFAGAAANGCDSIVDIQLEILPAYETQLNEQISEGDSYSLAGQNFTASGIYTVVLSATNGCDSTLTLNLRVNTSTSTLTDSIAIGQSENICVNTDIFQSLASFNNLCPQSAAGTDFILDGTSGCVDYTGIAAGVDTACLLACDELGICDTTYLVVSVFDNLLAAVDDYDTTLYDQPLTIDVLVNDWTSETVIDTQYLVNGPEFGTAVLNSNGSISYTPELNACLQSDQLSYAICNAVGCDTAEVYIFLDEVSGLCSGVWPGDVNNDGIVNQIDHWAVGLAYGENGPIRPNASFEWVAQPAIDWNGTFTFIQEINLKYADCNGTGQINTDDVGPIYVNWGLTHMAPYYNPFPERNIPVQSERREQDNQVVYELSLGNSEHPLVSAYGLGFAISFDPEQVESLSFNAESSIYGLDGDNLMVLEKVGLDAGYAYISLVRNDHQPVEDFGRIGQLEADCPTGDCGTITISELQLLQIDGDVFNIPGVMELNAGPVSTTQEVAEQTTLHLFPNPVKERLQVVSAEAGFYQLYSSRGELVQQGNLNEGRNEVQLENTAPGLYFLQARIGNQLLVRKLIVQ